jgi:hypothetical protein
VSQNVTLVLGLHKRILTLIFNYKSLCRWQIHLRERTLRYAEVRHGSTTRVSGLRRGYALYAMPTAMAPPVIARECTLVNVSCARLIKCLNQDLI